ncbi:DUF2216 domain containing protein [Sarcoptes scabiei]|uniref:DUF2216 domain containing protein n=1 Tax=Sarcoptes scabiei TaxID=52283 RepID=A0A131ZU85_SARSC|nr:DUF2216 domain containing protein [Sarcoptes scabiei]
MDKCDEELFDLKQKIVDLVKENNEMKELILFLDDERNYARQFVKDFNAKQSMNWNSLKQKLNYLEQKQFELIKENYSLKQADFKLILNFFVPKLCVLLDENNAAAINNSNSNLVSHPQPPTSLSSSSSSSSATTSPPSSSTIILNKSSSIICQYIINLENELKNRGYTMNRPKYVQNLLKLNSLREDPSINDI